MSNVVEYYIRVGVISHPPNSRWVESETLTTDWFNGLSSAEKKRVWDRTSSEWYQESITESSESEFMKKVDDKLQQNKVNDYVKNIESPPVKDLKTNIPDNPFDAVDDDEFDSDSDELTYKQNMKFNRYLNKLGFKDFNSWWEQEGKEELSDIYSEAIINNEQMPTDGNISKWWRNYLDNNLTQIIRQLKFIQIWVP